MARYFATCARGLEPILVTEIAAVGANHAKQGRGGVSFEGGLDVLYKVNLWARTAVRVLQPVLEATVESPEALYDAVRTISWNEYLTPDHTLAVDANVRDSEITHSQYASRKVKDAICDQFRERTGVRPSVDPERPMVGFNLHISRNKMVLSLDSSVDSLHKRGYRPALTKAPLNEALAAGLLSHLGYTGQMPLVDPLCGSGTFCIEGAWIALDRPPGLTRKWFGFQGWPSYDASLFAALRDDARLSMKKNLDFTVTGTDVRRDAIEHAKDNGRAAGLGNFVRFAVCDLSAARPPLPAGPPGLMVINPPYGERIGEEKELVPLYRLIGQVVREHWQGWRVAVFTSNDWLASQILLPVKRKSPFYNGAIPCLLWEYQFDGDVKKEVVEEAVTTPPGTEELL